MKTVERRLRVLESAANIKPLKLWKRVIVGVGETIEEVRAREGYTEDQAVIADVIVEPCGKKTEYSSVCHTSKKRKNLRVTRYHLIPG